MRPTIMGIRPAPATITSILALALAAWLLAGCTASPPGRQSAGSPTTESAAPGKPTAAASRTPRSTPTTPPTPILSTTYTADDAQIATLIRAGVDEALPQLEELYAMDPSKQVALFEPLGAWISQQVTDLEAYDPSSCTAMAVSLYLDGMDQYDDIRKRFLAWKDWGANGHAFSVAAPRAIATTLKKAVAELEAHCAD